MMRLWPCKRYVDQFAVYGGGNAVEFRTVQAVIVESDATDRHYIPALAHADNRVIAAIGHVEVRTVVKGRVARPVDVIGVSVNGGKINRPVQGPRLDAADRPKSEGQVGGISDDTEIDDGDRVVKRLADKQLAHHR